MTYKSQELALAVLKEARVNGNLDKAIEAELAELIGTEARPQVKEALSTHAAAEAEKRELTPEQADKLLSTLRSRFDDAEEELRKAVDFAAVEKSLRAAPEKLYALQKLEETGGEPQVIGIDGDEFIFEDRSAESPTGRRNLDADQSAVQADEFGVDMQSPEAYKAMQKTGKYDLNSQSWLERDAETRNAGDAVRGIRHGDVVDVQRDRVGNHAPYYGWRASLRVKKV